MSAALDVRSLTTRFDTRKGPVTAVNDVNFSVQPGRIMGLAGENGSRKSVTGFSILGLIDAPGQITEGQVLVDGTDLRSLSPDALPRMRGKHVAMVFQEPMMTLNPVLRVGDQMAMAVRVHDRVSKSAAWDRARQALETMGIPAPAERLRAYPHQLSGGVRERVAIATALLYRPSVIIADESTTALDVSIQAQVLNLFMDLRKRFGLTAIFISHDLGVVRHVCDRVAIMYLAAWSKMGRAETLYASPQHPYTRALLASVPTLGTGRAAFQPTKG
ncbi:ABC transporter ATP-binding protein [Citreicella sp. C3M06]|uniref:ABC transporter ATP-binding protein n=1 Tax=Citreicella sp. C3M06 TaxID=2841564 RepID=UPI001C099F09|nr:ABC transporter ATP-binding protein [Citreicella sp. C3M06]MBU2961632.1 ABC transporter ATP-binding protein [Citreicella sp. C3M06]